MLLTCQVSLPLCGAFWVARSDGLWDKLLRAVLVLTILVDDDTLVVAALRAAHGGRRLILAPDPEQVLR